MKLDRNLTPLLKTLSIIITSRNEADNLPDCIREICKELNKESIQHEILVIDDGSTDESQEIINGLKIKYPLVKYIKNEGKICLGLFN